MKNFKVLSQIEREEASFILKGFLPIPKNAVTLLSASGGTGKTRLSLIMADRHIRDSKQNKVCLWLTEDYPGQVRAIFEDMVQEKIVVASSMSNMIIVLDNPPQLAKRVQGVFKANYEAIKEIGDAMVSNGVTFAIFDPLLAFYGGNENDNSEARIFIQTFATWANESEITTLIIHHANKDGASRGATAFHDGVRARYELDFCRTEDGEQDKHKTALGYRMAILKKDNWGIRKYLWSLTDGEDFAKIKVTPELKNQYKREEVKEPVITAFEDNNNFMGGIA